MTLKIKKTYGSNFDLITAEKEGQHDKSFIKTIKTSDEIGAFENNQDGWTNISTAFEGFADCEFEITVDTNEALYDSLGNVYFMVVEV